MDSVLACYAAGTGMIPATSRCFLYRLEVGSIKMEPEKVKFCSSASIVDEKIYTWVNREMGLTNLGSRNFKE